MYTAADLLFYYYVIPRTLYMLSMPITRNWFISNIDRFKERSTTTLIAGSGHYTTRERLVQILDVMKELPGVIKEQI